MGFEFGSAAPISHAMVPEPAGEFTSRSEYEPGHADALFGKDGFTFADLIDIINPLQHIPVISTIYRALTGDTIDAGPRVLGGAVFGGPIGAVSALANAVVEGTTGKDLGDHVLALLTGEDETEGGVAVAANAPAPAKAEPSPQPGAVTRAALAPPTQDDAEEIAAMPVAAGNTPPEPSSPPGDFAAPRHPAFAPEIVAAAASPAASFGDLRHPLFDTAAEAPKTAPLTPAVAAQQRAANGWLYQAMMRALDKYQAGSHLTQTADSPSRTVVR